MREETIRQPRVVIVGCFLQSRQFGESFDVRNVCFDARFGAVLALAPQLSLDLFSNANTKAFFSFVDRI